MMQRNPRYFFNKSERLSSQKSIQELFAKGSSFFVFPYKIIYLHTEFPNTTPPKLLISVPKKIFKKAVDRNKIRRRIKEAYRQNKHMLLPVTEKNLSLSVAFIYVAKDILPFDHIENKLKKTLLRLSQVLQ